MDSTDTVATVHSPCADGADSGGWRSCLRSTGRGRYRVCRGGAPAPIPDPRQQPRPRPERRPRRVNRPSPTDGLRCFGFTPASPVELLPTLLAFPHLPPPRGRPPARPQTRFAWVPDSGSHESHKSPQMRTVTTASVSTIQQPPTSLLTHLPPPPPVLPTHVCQVPSLLPKSHERIHIRHVLF